MGESGWKSKSVFPPLDNSIPFRQWQAEVELIIQWHPIFRGCSAALKKAAEAGCLLSAVRGYPTAAEALMEVKARKDNNEFAVPSSTDTAEEDTRWVQACWEALKKVCTPVALDACNEASEALEQFPKTAYAEYGGRIPGICQRFRTLRSNATLHDAGYRPKRLAYLLRTTFPLTLQLIISSQLKDDQHNPDKVLECLEALSSATGATLGLSPHAVVQDEGPEALYTGQRDRPQGRGDQGGRGGRQSWRGGGRPRGQGVGVGGNSAGRGRSGGQHSCSRCGGDHSDPDQCPALGKTCARCDGRGHYARCCRTRMEEIEAAKRSKSPDGGPREAGGGQTGGKSVTFQEPAASSGSQSATVYYTDMWTEEHGDAWLATVAPAQAGGDHWNPTAILVDTCCTHTVVPRADFEASIMHEEAKRVHYRVADKAAGGFITDAEACLALTFADENGRDMTVALRANLTDTDVRPLLSPKYTHLVPGQGQSWIVMRDWYGKDRKILVDCPQGGPASVHPYVESRPACHAMLMEALAVEAGRVLSVEELRQWHVRLCHPGVKRLTGTLKELGLTARSGDVVAVTGGCETCKRKNATHLAVPRSTTRRARSTFGSDMHWDLGYCGEAGYKGEHTFSLFVDERTLWMSVLPLTSKAGAHEHLKAWLSEAGPMKTLHSDNEPILKSVKVRVICDEQNVHMAISPPYQSEAMGIIERGIREFRTLLKTALHEAAGWFEGQTVTALWPVLAYGVVDVHNRVVSPQLGASPWFLRYGLPPTHDFLLGDKVIIRDAKEAKGPKTLALPGVPVIYIGPLNAQTSLVVRHRGQSLEVTRIHPSRLKRGARVAEARLSPLPALKEAVPEAAAAGAPHARATGVASGGAQRGGRRRGRGTRAGGRGRGTTAPRPVFLNADDSDDSMDPLLSYSPPVPPTDDLQGHLAALAAPAAAPAPAAANDLNSAVDDGGNRPASESELEDAARSDDSPARSEAEAEGPVASLAVLGRPGPVTRGYQGLPPDDSEESFECVLAYTPRGFTATPQPARILKEQKRSLIVSWLKNAQGRWYNAAEGTVSTEKVSGRFIMRGYGDAEALERMEAPASSSDSGSTPT
eukprot:GHVU01179187.1.p1 GENE.GHVU01179187.1~~GHVU01179187.1.p1  ORF type:complete len:1095 (+),score=134.15 GHVU01179187.1:3467-6751(+)